MMTALPSLSAVEFSSFFLELHGHPPFPWQTELVVRVCDSGWPEALDLPTASGKTAVLDVALFHLAMEADRGSERRAPVRIAFVVDRRLIVDQAEQRALSIRKSLMSAPPGSVASRVAVRLRALCGDGLEPLHVAKLRGGMPRETDWARTPAHPTILLSTVDQVGSRLLFRGYGVSDSMKPVHAGLLGSDCLILLDEAHLSEPFRQTLGWVGRYRAAPWTSVKAGPWRAVNLSATPGLGTADDVFRLSAADFQNEVLRARLRASKLAELIEIPNEAAPAQIYAREARRLCAGGQRSNVLIVVNRVDLARAVFDELAGGEERMLLIGRNRDASREDVVAELEQRLQRAANARPLFVVATQCIEAGADVDFDALVTQLAPMDALRQRFGRLNRRGRPIEAAAAILATREERKPKRPDPIYGLRAAETWPFLESIAVREGNAKRVDFGIAALGGKLDGMPVSDKLDAPIVAPAYIDLWSQTSPVPEPDPYIPLFLHGPQSADADLSVVWRADLDLEMSDEDLVSLLSVAPPRAAEALAIPMWKLRSWLGGNARLASSVSDIEGESDPSERLDPVVRKQVFRWLGEDNDRTGRVFVQDLRAGDVIVLPAGYGGCDRWGWAPEFNGSVEDLADRVAAKVPSRSRVLRLHRSLIGSEPDADRVWARVEAAINDAGDDARELAAAMRMLESLPDRWQHALAEMRPGTELIALRYPNNNGILLLGKPIPGRGGQGESTESDGSGAYAPSAVSLRDHTDSVVRKAIEFSCKAGVGAEIAEAVQLAAKLHDTGKGDLRFQAYLSGGGVGPMVLAKSGRTPVGPERALRAEIGLPDRWRHEALSVRVALADSEMRNASDPALVLWLIGTHHGYGRPFFPHDDEMDDHARSIRGAGGENIELPAASGPQRLDFDWEGRDWASLFEELRAKYGPWELARIEALLRLADHRASEEGAAP